MSKEEKGKKLSLAERMNEFQKSQAKRETFAFPKDKSVFVMVDSVKEQKFTKSGRDWLSMVYRAIKSEFNEDGSVKTEEPIVFFGNTVLDGEIEEHRSYLITYLGKPKGYHDYMVVETTMQDIRTLAAND